jgi:hypothetical protein
MPRTTNSAAVISEIHMREAENAGRARRNPPLDPPGLHDDHIMAGTFRSQLNDKDRRIQDQENRLAAQRIRRMCNRHNCELWRDLSEERVHWWADIIGPACSHPNHKRDADYLKRMLDICGLSGGIPDLSEDDYKWPGDRDA